MTSVLATPARRDNIAIILQIPILCRSHTPQLASAVCVKKWSVGLRQRSESGAYLHARLIHRPKNVATKGSPKSPTDGSNTLFLLSVLSSIVTIFGVLTFVAGWSYLAHYYDYFGLSLGDANIGVYGVAIHGLSAAQIGSGRVILLFYIAIIFLLIILRVDKRSNRSRSLFAAIIILLLIVATSWLAGSAGTFAAGQDSGDNSSLPNITISTPGGTTCQTGKLLRRKDNVYFVARIHSCSDHLPSISTGVVTTLPTDTVLIDHYMR